MKLAVICSACALALPSVALGQTLTSPPASSPPGVLGNPAAQGAEIRQQALPLPSHDPSAHMQPRPLKLKKPHRRESLLHRAERSGYKKVSSLVDFPPFFPGIGIVYVKPANLPVGPFLSFDRKSNLVSTIYMVPLEDMQNHKKFDAGGALRPVDHVTIYFNGGHPGVDMPHYHIVNWHVTRKGEAVVAR